jgi:hypothetical protein
MKLRIPFIRTSSRTFRNEFNKRKKNRNKFNKRNARLIIKNYKTSLKGFKVDLSKWKNSPYSWIKRVNFLR